MATEALKERTVHPADTSKEPAEISLSVKKKPGRGVFEVAFKGEEKRKTTVVRTSPRAFAFQRKASSQRRAS